MKSKIFNLVLILSLVVSHTALAQKSKPKASTPTAKGMSLAEANKMIQYTNSVSMLMNECFSARHIGENQMLYHRNLEQDTREKKTSQDAFENKKYATQEDCLATIKSMGATDPRIPPAEIGSTNQAFFREKFATIEKLFSELEIQNKAMKKYFDDNIQLRNKKDKESAKIELDKFDALAESLYKEQDAVYEKAYELGDKAEAVTLAKHPLVKEIMDMKKILRLSEQVTRLAQGDAETVEKNLPRIENILTEMKQNSADYANYEVFRKGQSPRMDEARQYVKEYYGKAEDFYAEIQQLKNNYKGDKPYERTKWQKYIVQRYQYFLQAYNNFVESNNR